MPLFEYACVRSDGIKATGTLEAACKEEALKKLLYDNNLVLSIKAKRFYKKASHLNRDQLIDFIEQLAYYLKAGLPLYESLAEIAKEALQDKKFVIFQSLCDQIKLGSSLAQAMRGHPKSFPEIVIATVEAGQASGHLDVSLQSTGLVLRKQQKLSKTWLCSLLYPAILLSFSTLLIGILLLFVVPSLEMLFEQQPVSGLTAWVIGASHLLRKGYPFLILAWGLPIFLGIRFLKVPSNRLKVELFCLQMPIIGPLLSQKELGRFAHLMGLLLKGGVPLLQALQMASNGFQLLTYKKLMEEMEKRVLEGKTLSTELKTVKIIPSLFSRLLLIGDESGNSAEMFYKIAELYETEVDRALARLTQLAQPAILLAIGILVGVIMLAILLPLTDINAFI